MSWITLVCIERPKGNIYKYMSTIRWIEKGLANNTSVSHKLQKNMPSSHMFCSEGWLLEWSHCLQRQENGKQTKQNTPENLGQEGESFLSSMLLSFSLLSAVPTASPNGLPLWISNFKSFVELKMPGSPGFVAAHHMYNTTTHVICKRKH